MASVPPTQSQGKCRFLQLPRELRDRVYKNLLSIKHTKTPKDVEAGLRSSTRYDWNIDPTILRVSRRISEEAKELIGRDNRFVVIERSPELEQLESDTKAEDPEIMVYNVRLWPGKKSKTVNVPGERMRVRLTKDADLSSDLDIYVLQVEELRDFCVAVSISLKPDETYVTSGLYASIGFVDPAYKETPQEIDNMRTALMHPLTRLRHFADVSVEGMPPMVAKLLLSPLLLTTSDASLVNTTIHDLIHSGDRARTASHFSIAQAYYQRAHEYFHHHAIRGSHVFDHPADPLALDFKLMQHIALNHILNLNFGDANEAADVALRVANLLFRASVAQQGPSTAQGGGPRKNAAGIITKGAFRSWTCQCIKEGAERNGQRIRAEDVGRVYYYRSIAGHCVGGNAAAEQADEDKMTGIGCCLVSDTVGEENVPKELLELDMRVMERLGAGDGGVGSEDEWVDEEEDDVG